MAVAAVGRSVGAHAGQLGGKHAEQSELAPGEPLGDEHGEITALAPRRPHDAILVGCRDRDDSRNGGKGRRQVLAEGRYDNDPEILLVLGDRPAEAVVNRPPRRRHQLHGQAIFVGEQPIFRGIQDLQLAETPEQQSEQPCLPATDQDRPPREAVAKPKPIVRRLPVRPK